MHARRWTAALLAGVFLAITSGAQAGRLDDVQRASGPSRARSRPQRQHTSSSHSSSGSSWSSSRDDDDDDDSDGEVMGALMLGFGYLLVSPWLIPSRFDLPCAHAYAAYPDKDGFMRSAAWDPRCASAEQPGVPVARAVVRKLAGNAGVEASYGVGRLAGGGVSAQLLLPRRIELSFRMSMLAELSTSPVDQAIASNTTFAVRFAQTERLAFRCGAGLRTFFLDERRLGPDFVYAVSVFGRHGLRWELEAHAGALSHAFAGELRASLGIMLGRSELFAGYDYFHVRGPAGSATLHGPMLGLRVWM